MDKHEHSKLDQHIKNTLMDGEATPPALVWDNLSKELYPPRKRKTFWWAFFALLIVLLSALLLIALSHKHSLSPSTINKNSEKKNAPIIIAKNEYELNKNNVAEPRIESKKITDNNSISPTNAAQSNINLYATHKAAQNIAPVSKIIDAAISPSASKNQSNFNPPATKQVAPNKQVALENEKKTEQILKSALPEIKNSFSRADSTLAENSIPNPMKGQNKITVFAHAGLSFFDQAVFNTRLSTGALNPAQKSENKGFQYGIGGTYALNKKQSIGIGISYNQKYSYLSNHLHVSPSDFLNYHNKKQLVPVENLDKVSCDEYFYINHFVFEYQVQHYLFQLGYNHNIVSSKKWDYAVNFACFTNLSSSLRILSNETLSGIQNEQEHFSYLGMGIGNSLNYKIGNKLTIGIAPQISTQLFKSRNSVFAKQGFEIIVPIQLGYRF